MRSSRTSSIAASALLAALLLLTGFRAGDTLIATFEALDAAGYPVIPATARVYWYVNNAGVPAMVDSADVLGSGVAALPRAASGNAGTYYSSYLLPSSGSNSVAGRYPQVWAKVRYTTTGGAITWVGADLGHPLNSGPDTMRVEAVEDYWQQVASATQATITGDTYGGTEVTSLGSPVEGARVWVTRTDNPSVGGTNLLGLQERSDANGEFNIPVPISATSADTYYLWAYKSGRYYLTSVDLTIP